MFICGVQNTQISQIVKDSQRLSDGHSSLSAMMYDGVKTTRSVNYSVTEMFCLPLKYFILKNIRVGVDFVMIWTWDFDWDHDNY